MIVKAQVSTVLIYNKDNTVMCEFDINEMLALAMGGALKKYFNASIKKDKLILGSEASEADYEKS
jgi:hypothetical protein